jgi:acyl-CoA thioesterase-1
MPDEVGKELQVSVDNRAISGASFYGVIDDAELINFKDQYELGNWDWVLINGSGNDLNDKCDCDVCGDVINEIISSDATTSELPNLVNQLKQNVNKMVFVMFPKILTGAEYGFDQCREEFTKIELRIKLLAVNTDDFWFVSALDVVPTREKSYFVDDLVHPSVDFEIVVA